MMTPDEKRIKEIVYQVLGKTQHEYKIESIASKILDAYQKLRIASIDFDIAAEMETSITDKEWLHTSWSLLMQRRKHLLMLWEVAFNTGVADQKNDKALLHEIMPHLEKIWKIA